MPVKVWSINGVTPVVDPSAFVHPSAVLIGDVVVGPGCYIGPLASLRGDFGRIEVRAGANIQDSCVMHGFPGTDTIVEEDGHIGHGAILHGCIVKRNALVGMNAVVNDNAVIGESGDRRRDGLRQGRHDRPAAHAGRRRAGQGRARTDRAELAWKIEGTQSYQELTRRSLATMRETDGARRRSSPIASASRSTELLPLSTLKQRG